MKPIYLDYNATTPIDPRVAQAMIPYVNDHFGNPSSGHVLGVTTKKAVENARSQVAGLLRCEFEEVVFTSGGSEADNLAIKGAAFARRERGNHIITTNIEPPAVLGACAFLEKTGFRVTYLPVDKHGWLAPATLRQALTDETILVSIMMANNEVGTILPVKELCAIARARGVLFHTDAVQAAGKIPVDVNELGVDLLSISGHKFHAPKGVGALYVREGVEIEPLIHGGKQETGLRAGTENVAGIVGLGKAAELALQGLRSADGMRMLRDRLETGVRELVPDAVLNGHPDKRLPNTLNMTLPELRGESVVVALDQHGIALSSGSACKSGSPKPTHVLIAMGKTEEDAHCSVRFSLSRYNTPRDIDATVAALGRMIEAMETTVRFLPCK